MKTFFLQVGNEAFLLRCDDKEAALEKFKLLARTDSINESKVVEITNAGVFSIYSGNYESDDYFLEFTAIN